MTSELTLTDLDELVLTVRDRNSRAYIGEAITAYRARAFRSAVMAAWVAVAYDVIAKLRELAVQGDRAAQGFVAELDAAVEANGRGDPGAVPRLQKIEGDLLGRALREFELLSPHEHVDLDRLKADRNLCAHPAFSTDSLLFQPTPELVRAHIAHAILHLLRHPPVQGLNALRRLKRDLLQPSFPTDPGEVAALLEARYLNHAKRALLENLVAVLLKIMLLESEPDLVGKEAAVGQCLAAVRGRFPDLYAAKMAEQLPRLTDGLGDPELRRAFRLFAVDPACWGWLPEPTRVRLRGMARVPPPDPAAAALLFSGLAVGELRPLLQAAFAGMDDTGKETVIIANPRPEFAEEAIRIYAEAGSYRGAERYCAGLVLPLAPVLEARHIDLIVDAYLENGEIHDAAKSPDQIRELFGKTSRLHAAARPAWQRLIRGLLETREPHEHYACPDLRAEMERAGMWPA
ncbi:MAG: hypothetical protein C0501_05150 [Isosphaera sp.]|jgi:hypothetical protein|nr:hypothetical protein [Isosphaera sp.]